MAAITAGAIWPPENLATIRRDMNEWEAWWVGDPARLAATTNTNTRSKGGLFRRLMFWGRHNNRPEDRPSRADLHVPLAADICETSAQLLYGKPPQLTVKSEDGNPPTPTGRRVNEYVEDGLLDQLVQGAETGAALGGRFHRVTWDNSHSRPFITTVDADQAIPYFSWGELKQVIFCYDLEDPNPTIGSGPTTYWRHLETHYLDENGNGRIRHELYEGTKTQLGSIRPLVDHPTTAPLATQVDADATITTGITPGLCVTYFPNLTPQRRWRDLAAGRDLGRSDLDGLTGLLDALDETWNAWMRDVRLAKARIIARKDMLEDRDGNPTFDLDQEVFEGVETLGSIGESSPLQPVQFSIRFAEHAATIDKLVANIIRSAGYSPATFGEQEVGVMTATEVRAREKATLTTRDRKIRLEQPRLEDLLVKMLTIDADVYGTKGLNPDEVDVAFPDIAIDSPEAAASTASTLAAARIASTETLVAMVHPDWDAKAVAEEVERIKQDSPLTSPDAWRPPQLEADEPEE